MWWVKMERVNTNYIIIFVIVYAGAVKCVALKNTKQIVIIIYKVENECRILLYM